MALSPFEINRVAVRQQDPLTVVLPVTNLLEAFRKIVAFLTFDKSLTTRFAIFQKWNFHIESPRHFYGKVAEETSISSRH